MGGGRKRCFKRDENIVSRVCSSQRMRIRTRVRAVRWGPFLVERSIEDATLAGGHNGWRTQWLVVDGSRTSKASIASENKTAFYLSPSFFGLSATCAPQENQYTLSFLGAIDGAKPVHGGETGADSAAAASETTTTGPLAKRMRVP